MGNRLIVLCPREVTLPVSCLSLSDWMGSEGGPGKNPRIWTVPETDTGGLVEYTQAFERMVLKELGKLPP